MKFRVTAMLSRSAQQYPGNTCSVDVASGRERTYAESLERVSRLAGGLQAHGLSSGGRVAIISLNSDRYLETFFACSWAGGVVVPVNIRLAPPEMVDLLNDAEVEFVVVDEAFRALADAVAKQVPSVKNVIYSGDLAAPAGCLDYEALVRAGPAVADSMRGGDDTFMLMYTGGTTGKAKGVMLTHANLSINALGHVAALRFSPSSRYLHSAPMFHLANGNGLFTAATVGATHVMIPKFVPEEALRAMADFRITKAMMVPAMLAAMLQVPDQERFDCGALEDIVYGASPMPSALLEKVMAKFPNAQWSQGYGMSETSPAITMLTPEFHTPGNPKLGAVGRPVPWVEVKVADAEDREVSRGTVGQILTRGPHVMKGYWRMPDKTAEALRGGWMHTEDAGYMDSDGFIFLVDRYKDMIISGGENVYSSEVESAIMRFPGIAMCAVIGTPDAKFGEAVTAVVVPEPSSTVDEKALVAHCKKLIAGYKCPRKVLVRDALPMSGAGKILKHELRKEFASGSKL